MCSCALWAQSSSAQFVEVAADLTTTGWRNSTNGVTAERHWHYSARCVISTGSWLVHDRAVRNAENDWWFTGSNIVWRTLTTKEPYSQDLHDVRDWVSQKVAGGAPQVKGVRLPHRGDEWVEILPSSDGRPPNTMAVLPWLAFCSGSFLTNAGRQIPMPFTSTFRDEVIDKTVTFAEPCGLPRRVEFRRSNGHLLARYEVLQSTNFSGRTFPTEFAVTAYDRETSRVTARIMGNVTAMKRLDHLDVPTQMKKAFDAARTP